MLGGVGAVLAPVNPLGPVFQSSSCNTPCPPCIFSLTTGTASWVHASDAQTLGAEVKGRKQKPDLSPRAGLSGKLQAGVNQALQPRCAGSGRGPNTNRLDTGHGVSLRLQTYSQCLSYSGGGKGVLCAGFPPHRPTRWLPPP